MSKIGERQVLIKGVKGPHAGLPGSKVPWVPLSTILTEIRYVGIVAAGPVDGSLPTMTNGDPPTEPLQVSNEVLGSGVPGAGGFCGITTNLGVTSSLLSCPTPSLIFMCRMTGQIGRA